MKHRIITLALALSASASAAQAQDSIPFQDVIAPGNTIDFALTTGDHVVRTQQELNASVLGVIPQPLHAPALSSYLPPQGQRALIGTVKIGPFARVDLRIVRIERESLFHIMGQLGVDPNTASVDEGKAALAAHTSAPEALIWPGPSWPAFALKVVVEERVEEITGMPHALNPLTGEPVPGQDPSLIAPQAGYHVVSIPHHLTANTVVYFEHVDASPPPTTSFAMLSFELRNSSRSYALSVEADGQASLVERHGQVQRGQVDAALLAELERAFAKSGLAGTSGPIPLHGADPGAAGGLSSGPDSLTIALAGYTIDWLLDDGSGGAVFGFLHDPQPRDVGMIAAFERIADSLRPPRFQMIRRRIEREMFFALQGSGSNPMQPDSMTLAPQDVKEVTVERDGRLRFVSTEGLERTELTRDLNAPRLAPLLDDLRRAAAAVDWAALASAGQPAVSGGTTMLLTHAGEPGAPKVELAIGEQGGAWSFPASQRQELETLNEILDEILAQILGQACEVAPTDPIILPLHQEGPGGSLTEKLQELGGE